MRSDPPREGPRHLLLGLGNPGERYRETRHNAGFRVLEEVARRRGVSFGREQCRSLVAQDGDLLLALPQTYMNRSGYAARCLVELHELPVEGVLLVYDELALPLGKIRLRPRGGPAGHRGVESVLENLRTDHVQRLRIGIAPEAGAPAAEEVVGFVLSPFGADEAEIVEEVVERAANACETWLTDGIEAAMNQFNG